MKIVFFTDTYAPQTNGIVAYLQDTIALLSRNHEVVLFAPGNGRLRMEKVSGNFRIWWIPSSPFPFYEGYRIASFDYRRISSLLKKEKPDIVHAHAPINLGLQGVIAAKRKKIPVVVTYHTHFPDYVPHLLNGKLPAPFMRLGRYTAKKFVKHVFGMADIVTAPTHELVKELRSYGLHNAVYLPNGIDVRKLGCSKKHAEAFRKAHGIGDGKKIVLYLGRISFEKRLDRLLKAFSAIERKDRVLLVVGGGPYLKDFKDFARALGMKNVIFTGFAKYPAPAYCCADVFASASDSETFGLTFVEAMHFGLPVIGVSRLGAKEVIKDGKNGILVEPDDTDALSRAIEKLLLDRSLRLRMGREGMKTAKKYSIDRSIRETLKIYEGLIDRAVSEST